MCVPILPPKEPKSKSFISSAHQEPKPISQSIRNKREEDRRKARASNGRQSTLLTGSMGLKNRASTQKKTLLGD